MFGNILQPTHLLLILIVALLVLGPKRLPEAGKSLGRGLRDFKAALSTDQRDQHNEVPSRWDQHDATVSHRDDEAVSHTSAASTEPPREPTERAG